MRSHNFFSVPSIAVDSDHALLFLAGHFLYISSMIAANELRIGSWVKIKDTEIQLNILEIVYGEIVDPPIAPEPIPLTEEWLLKFGYEKSKYLDRVQWLSPVIERVQPQTNARLGIMFNETIGFSYEDSVINVCIKYVHQLQNLYFALTNTELTIKHELEKNT